MKLRLRCSSAIAVIPAIIIALLAYAVWDRFVVPPGLPPEWGMETDGNKYRYVRPSGANGWFEYGTQLGCRRAAWRQYHLTTKEASRNWVPVPGLDTTNSSISVQQPLSRSD